MPLKLNFVTSNTGKAATLRNKLEKYLKNRSQFHLTNGNYSNCDISVISSYIDKIVDLNYV